MRDDRAEEDEAGWGACEISLYFLSFPCHMYSISQKGQERQG